MSPFIIILLLFNRLVAFAGLSRRACMRRSARTNAARAKRARARVRGGVCVDGVVARPCGATQRRAWCLPHKNIPRDCFARNLSSRVLSHSGLCRCAIAYLRNCALIIWLSALCALSPPNCQTTAFPVGTACGTMRAPSLPLDAPCRVYVPWKAIVVGYCLLGTRIQVCPYTIGSVPARDAWS